MSPNTERHYRVHYPRRERPTRRVGFEAWEVIDLSETGVLCRQPEGPVRPNVGPGVRGVIHFHRRIAIPILGVVVRSEAHRGGSWHVGIRFSRAGIPFAAIFDEQRYLHSRYPCW